MWFSGNGDRLFSNNNEDDADDSSYEDNHDNEESSTTTDTDSDDDDIEADEDLSTAQSLDATSDDSLMSS